MLRIVLAVGIGLMLLVGSGLVASMARAQQASTADASAVISAFEAARTRRDIEGALTYFADDASVSVRNTQYAGKDEIRKYLEAPLTRSRSVVVSDRKAIGNRVTWTERMNTQGSTSPQLQRQSSVSSTSGSANATGFAVSVEAIVQDGKIHALTYLAGGQIARPDPSLEGRVQLPATVGLGAVLAMMAGVLVFASVGSSRATPGVSTMRGRLMHDLKGWSAAREPL